MQREAKTDHIYLRIRKDAKDRFIAACAAHPGAPSDVLRWLLAAFAEGRVTVSPTTPKE